MIKFTLYDLPPSLNEWQNLHHMKKARLKKQVENDVHYATYNKRPPQPYEKAHVKITIYFLTNRRRDERNYDCKWLIDGLVTAKLIKDDNTNVISRPKIVLEYDPKNPRVEIEITELTTEAFSEWD